MNSFTLSPILLKLKKLEFSLSELGFLSFIPTNIVVSLTNAAKNIGFKSVKNDEVMPSKIIKII